MGHKNYRQCSHIWLEDVCKVLRHDSYCKWAIEATMVWRTPADYLLANCDQFTACNCESILTLNVSFKHENCSLHKWKVPLKYRGMLSFPSGPLGLGQAADTMVWGGGTTKWRE
jgi:hypothetical protein